MINTQYKIGHLVFLEANQYTVLPTPEPQAPQPESKHYEWNGYTCTPLCSPARQMITATPAQVAAPAVEYDPATVYFMLAALPLALGLLYLVETAGESWGG